MSHVVMKKSLAKALMDAGVEHYDLGGQIASAGDTGGIFRDLNKSINPNQNTLSEMLGLSNNFRANAPEIQRQNFMPRIQALQQQQGDVYGQQQSLANTLLAQSQQPMAQTPSVAQAQLAQATGANAAQQAAMMASQRGASANPALMARLAAQQGAQIQQGAAGQAATLMAQEQLARQQFDAQRQMQLQQMVQQQQQAMAQQGLSGESIQQGGLASLNQAITAGELGAQQINSGVAGENMQQQRGLFSQIAGAGAKLLGGFADGGYIPRMAYGGPLPMGIQNFSMAPISDFTYKNPATSTEYMNPVGGIASKIFNSVGSPQQPGMSMAGGPMDSMGSALPMSATMVANSGGKVPGKAEVQGDNLENDTKLALVSPGEIIIPRSIAMSDDAPKRAAEFVKHVKTKTNYNDVLGAKSDMENIKIPSYANGANPVPETPISQQSPSLWDRAVSLFTPTKQGLESSQEYLKQSDNLTRPGNSVVEQQEPIVDPEMMKSVGEPAQAQKEIPTIDVSQKKKSDEPDIMTQEGYSQLESNLEKSYLGEAQAKKDIQGEAIKAYEDEFSGLRAQEDMMILTQNSMSKIEEENDQLSQDIIKSKIDPNRFWSNKTTGSKMATLASMFLGALGAAAGGPNAVNVGIQQFDKLREEDIALQKSQLGTKENMLALNLKRLGSLQEAEAATRLQMNSIMAGKIAMAAAKLGNPAIMAEAQKRIFDLKKEGIPLRQTLVKEDLKKKMLNGQVDPAAAVNVLVEQQDRKEAGEEVAMVKGYQEGIQRIRRLYDQAKKIDKALPISQAKTKLNLINQEIESTLRQSMKGALTISPKDRDQLIAPLLVDTTLGYVEERAKIDNKLRSMEDLLGSRLSTPTLDRYKIPISKEAPLPEGVVRSKDGKLYQWTRSPSGKRGLIPWQQTTK